MAANFLHGVETIELDNGSRPVRVVKTAVIGVVGTAPCGAVNESTLLITEADGAKFGPALEGFTLPNALRAIYDAGVGTIVAINVLDPDKHKSQVTDEEITFNAYGMAYLGHPSVVDTVTLKDNATAVDTDWYKLDNVTGKVWLTEAGMSLCNKAVKASYDYADNTKVTPADIIGALDSNGKRTGMQLWIESMSRFGFSPKILIAPGFSSLQSVSTEMINLADRMSSIAYIDAPVGITPQQAIEGRGPQGSINFNTSSERARLCYPHVKAYNPDLNEEVLEPLSARASGLRAKVDNDRGYWWSNSNQEIPGITGVERYLTAQIDDASCEVNLLNEAGITTVFNGFGTGYRLWGNRTAAWPTVTHIKNFESVRRTADMINESLRLSSMQFIDRPINQALIDALVESGCAFIRKLVGDGAILGGTVWYDPDRNPKEELALGHLLLSYKFTAPPPLERLTQETEITDEYLLNLKGVQ